MRPIQAVIIAVCFALACSVPGFSQAIVEHAVITGGVSTAGGAGAKSIGKSVGGVFSGVAGALDAAGKGGSAASNSRPDASSRPAVNQKTTSAKATGSTGAAGTPVTKSNAALPPVDASAIKPGADIKDLLAKFGKPSMKMTEMYGSEVLEKFWYRRAGQDEVMVTVRDGKVASVRSSAIED